MEPKRWPSLSRAKSFGFFGFLIYIPAMRILVVEDEIKLREGLLDLLAGVGHEAHGVKNGQDALETCGSSR